MSITPFQALACPLACPLDGLPLHANGSAWRCESGHSFDIASQGSTNLLPVQHKRSRRAPVPVSPHFGASSTIA